MAAPTCIPRSERFFTENPQYRTQSWGKVTSAPWYSEGGWQLFYQRNPDCLPPRAVLVLQDFLRSNLALHPEFVGQRPANRNEFPATAAGYQAFFRAHPEFATDPVFSSVPVATVLAPLPGKFMGVESKAWQVMGVIGLAGTVGYLLGREAIRRVNT